MTGLYTGPSETSFKSKEEIDREEQIRTSTPTFLNYDATLPNWGYWNQRFADRAKQYQETEEFLQNYVEIQLPDRPCLINFISDIHAGSPNTDYDRLKLEIETIVAQPSSYVFLLGDEVDSFCWTETAINDTAEQIPQQYYWFREMVRYLSDNNKLLGLSMGNHSWTRKLGLNFYTMLQEVTNAPFNFGITYYSIKVGEQEYRITGSHQFPGGSQYNSVHPEERAIRFGGAWGSDIVVGGHTHQKQISQKPFFEFNGSRVVTEVSLGAYKTHDGFGNNLGLARHTPNSMYGVSIYLDNKERLVQPNYDIIKAHQAFSVAR